MRMPPPSLPAPAKERVRTPGGHSRAASNSNATDSNSNDAPPEPRTVADLNKLSNINLVPAQHTPKRWCSTAATLFEKAVDARIMGDIDQNYILLLRGVSIVVEIIPKSAQFNPKEESYVDLKKNVQQYLNELEVLKKKVNDRHAEWAKSQSSQQQLSAPIPQQNTILTPTVAPFSTRSSTATNQEQIPPPVAPTSSQPQPQPQPTSTSATTDALMARLRALQPGGSANSSNNTQSTSTASPSRVPLKQSPSLNNFASTTPASLSRPTTPMIVPSNQSFNSTNSRTASATDLLSTNAPAKLVRSPSNSQNQGASTRSLNDLKMTYESVGVGCSTDGRVYRGHIRWIVDVPVKNGEVGSGVVHIEPEWLHDGVDTAHIMNCLRGFTQASDPRLMMFEYRNIYEIIVCYDGSSNSVFASPTLKNLVSALFVGERDMGKIVKSQPIVLDGGFNGWMEFVKRKGLRTENWIEIGDGVGGGGSSLGADGQPPSNSGTPKISPTSASYTPAPYTTPKVSQYAPVKPYLPTQASTGSLYGNDPTRRSSYLNPTQFDNPFMNFNAGLGGVAGTSYVGGGAGYARLSGQQQGLQHSSSFSRGQGGYTGVTPDYPSLSPLKNAPAVPQKPSGISVSQQQQFPQPQVQQHGLQHQNSQSMLHQQQQQQFQQQQQYQQYQQQQQLQQLQAQQQYQAQQQQQQPLPPSIPAKPAQLPVQPQPQPTPPAVKKPPPPVPAKPRLSITSVELTSQTSPAYSNPSDFMPISQIGSIGVVGLKNLGNTCFINSTLQCLSGTVPLARYFLGGNYRKGINRSNPMGTKGVIVEEFSQIIKSMWSGQESIITPAQFKERIGEYAEQFKGTEQHDSQEFLSFLLDAVHEDLNIARSGDKAKAIDTKGQDDESIPDDIRLQMAWNNYRARNWSIIVDLFQGQLKSKLECLTCHTTSTTFNPFMYLSIPIPAVNSAGVKGGPVYLDECLDKFVEVEILDGEDAWCCSKCKRFYYQGPFKSKLDTYVDFPLASMDLGKYVPPSAGAPAGSQVYDLYAVSNHTGTLTGGHYTATVHNGSKNAWYNFSDTRVGVCDVNNLKSNSAYILFYVRKPSAGSQMTATDWWRNHGASGKAVFGKSRSGEGFANFFEKVIIVKMFNKLQRTLSGSGKRDKVKSLDSVHAVPDGGVPVYENEFVTKQRDASQEELVRTSDVSRVLILYTGGTIGMKNSAQGYSPAAGFLTETMKSMRRFNDPFAALAPDSRDILGSSSSSSSWAETSTGTHYQPVNLPLQYSFPSATAGGAVEIEKVHRTILVTPRSLYGKRIKYSILEYDPLMDSSNMTMRDWVKIVTDIEVIITCMMRSWLFTVCHERTDTMAYTASALSFMLEDLGKSVIVTALTIAGHFVIPEVTLFFAQKLYRGNRSSKVDAYAFAAFDSPNMRPLAEVSINIDVAWSDVLKPTTIASSGGETTQPLRRNSSLVPGITEATVRAFLSPPIAGVVLESFGSGNAPNNRPRFSRRSKKRLVTDAYATGKALASIGIVPGSDMTPESALTKLSYLLGKGIPVEECRAKMRSNLRGELTVRNKQMRFTYSNKTQSLVDSVLPLLGHHGALRLSNSGGDEVETKSPVESATSSAGGIDKVLIPTLLCHAARNGDVEALTDVAKQYASFVSVGDYDGRTPLHIAASENHYNAVEALLLHGASVHQRDRYGHSPLYDAVRNNHVKIVHLLRNAGLILQKKSRRKAAFEGNLDLIRLLCECGADMNEASLDGRTPVHMAVSGKQFQIIAFFIEHSKQLLGKGSNSAETPSGIEVKLDLPDRYGRTPLDDAKALNWKEGVECIESGLRELV
ncbi:hypothetical protein BCR33DRAFT_779534 [Rhizoclosmatium globosum]|uniref:asparaginase n=1 Tax=Rhizoclosmatium globosum TaxID=329046 RepID=A0A1Y2D1Z1_9FUNG|nr:hypothetical protein BCR33DRAFT_779534 [Rhizoclosmatium globosum]|eukprot:ORY53217.1 hypothetical protein BCR33DRAFT_779534 [Rhizoclosmatium globosum]